MPFMIAYAQQNARRFIVSVFFAIMKAVNFLKGFAMKYLIASDLHGAYTPVKTLLSRFEAEGANRILLLGDILYHGPRNPLTESYTPAQVACELNAYADVITAVRGNCDAEVDQMMLNFACQADYTQVVDSGVTLFLTHGHLPLDGVVAHLARPAALLTGHTHIKLAEFEQYTEGPVGPTSQILHINPGSVGLPKDGIASYATYENGTFKLKELESGATIKEAHIQ